MKISDGIIITLTHKFSLPNLIIHYLEEVLKHITNISDAEHAYLRCSVFQLMSIYYTLNPCKIAVKIDNLQAVAYPKMLYENYFFYGKLSNHKILLLKIFRLYCKQFMLWMWGSYGTYTMCDMKVSVILITICDRACENRPCERKKLPIFSVFAVS